MIRSGLIRAVDRLLADHAVERGAAVAFSDARRSLSYAELERRTRRLAGHLGGLGMSARDRAAIYLGNSVEAVEAQLSVVRGGGIAVPINPRSPEAEAAYMAHDSGARVLFVDSPRKAALPELLRAAPEIGRVVVVGDPDEPEHLRYEALALEPPSREMASAEDLDAPAWMVYTSGTTGRPKGVLLSQRGLLWVVAACWAPVVGLDSADYLLSPLPLFHSYAIDLTILGALAVGARAHVMDRFSTGEVLDLLAREPITLMPGVPTMFHYLTVAAPARGLGCQTLRACVSAGAILSAELTARFEEMFGVPLLDGYGITETSTMVTMNWPQGHRPRGSCGLPLLGSAVRIVDPVTGEDVPVGSDGELCVRGPHVMLGYHERPDATAQALAGGWYHTGDLGRADVDGYITITGRIKELIIRGGENVYPAEVESALLSHPQVRDCAVVGRAHEVLGETVVAFVVPEDPASFDAEAVKAHCARLLVAFKVPAEIHLVAEIPRTGSGKTMRHKLRALLEPAAAHPESIGLHPAQERVAT